MWTLDGTTIKFSGNFEGSVNDGEHIIYVNGSYLADTPLGKLVHDFNCKEAKDMYYKELADRVRYFKETEKVESMCRTMEVMRNEAEIQSAIRYGKKRHDTDDQIVEYLVSTYDYLREDEAVKHVEDFDEN